MNSQDGHDSAVNPYEQIVKGARGNRGQIDPELLPYLVEADREEKIELPISDASDHPQDAQRLREILQAGGIAMPEELADDEIISEGESGEDDAEAALSETAVPPVSSDEALQADFEVAQVYARILQRRPEHNISPTKARIERALDYLSDPQLSYPCLHIAGTNGKTSTARIADSLLSAQGMRVGRFTSPHLVSVRERISIDGEPISPQAFLQANRDVEPIIALADKEGEAAGQGRLSFFEYLTALAFQAFASAPIDVGVIEVGMGGRWDSTNVLDSAVQVICPISFDHEKWLGNTLTEIAGEKAGIIRPGATVICGPQEAEALEVIREVCREKNATLRLYGEDFTVSEQKMAVGGQMFTVTTPAASYQDLYLPLFGRHQAVNAALAIAAVEALGAGKVLSEEVLETGLDAARSPGRLEVLGGSPTVIVDAAHNPAGAAALRSGIEDAFGFQKVVGVFSAMGDKNVEGILAEMEPLLDAVVTLPMEGERAMEPVELAKIAGEVFGKEQTFAAPNLLDAVDQAVALTEESELPADAVGIVIFGSVVLAGQARQLLSGRLEPQNPSQ
ncbi:bifunctional folylpolyglutamate synthase/dihydrofolate synthase [Varibaculum massiliense]|uniref:bifunctional folylpolyglutamate synthase/dihydrofolate synthase n=1 Tax=Varibaculum massiliense TaxID=1852372 RepID=UPI0028896988|nr:folylpolyglutamate synthase/dihydrofolate synthase family protein [Varibaculum massiliense]